MRREPSSTKQTAGPEVPPYLSRHLPTPGPDATILIMKLAYILLGLLTLAISPVQAQCKDCGCKDKCSPSCKCPHDEKPKAQ